MFRTLGLLAIPATAIALVATHGRLGPLDLAEIPMSMLAFCAVSALVLIGLRHI